MTRHPYASFVHRVAKPARYLGGEYQQIVKSHTEVDVTIALAFPDVYDIGMSHLGTKILYSLLNGHPRIACERAFTPWHDMQAELRARGLPLLTLESARPLSGFDFVGISLQYEMTYTNVLTLLELGGIPLRAADRGDDSPLVIGGGPTAMHPEPMAPFFDLFLIGEAEEVLPDLLLDAKRMKQQGLGRAEVLAELAARGAVYVPSLYETETESDCGFEVVARPTDPRAPARVARAWVRELDRFPFPANSPVPHAEAVFDRAAIEIARGCTEGCRFCQAGMIYRPVRERSPQAVVDAVISSLERGGFDEVSLTSLSTADYSCVSPLIKRVAEELEQRKVALSVSSLRAYGLNDELLDDIARFRTTGLTFAPEAGTQRMRDVINKNVTEEDIVESARRVFGRGWNKMKLYFMIGLPTETEEDVRGIARTGGMVRRIGRSIRRDAEVTVSVSSHVPKPHTPFQWAAMSSIDELRRKQVWLRTTAVDEKVKLKHHDVGVSYVESILARGDRRLADVIEAAWRDGAGFDGWDEHFSLARWERALERCGVSPERYLGTIPVTARVPWDHIDIGLEHDFLLKEYRKALKDRLAPPCGKPFGSLLHHTNVADALADSRKLVCYDCGVACDLTQMRQERLDFLRSMGALERTAPRAATESAATRRVAALNVLQPVVQQATAAGIEVQGAGLSDRTSSIVVPSPPVVGYRLRYTKLGAAAYMAHLDLTRHIARTFRRAALPLAHTEGFHPRPRLSFGPALGLGVPALGELADVYIEAAANAAPSSEELLARLAGVSPPGLMFVDCARLGPRDAPLGRLIDSAHWLLAVEGRDARASSNDVESGKCYDASTPRLIAARLDAIVRAPSLWVQRERPQPPSRGVVPPPIRRTVDLRPWLLDLALLEGTEARLLSHQFGWPETASLVRIKTRSSAEGGTRPTELARLFAQLDDAEYIQTWASQGPAAAVTTLNEEIAVPCARESLGLASEAADPRPVRTLAREERNSSMATFA